MNFASGASNTPGDADLDMLINASAPTYDACVLEFDCEPLGDTLLFNFSFGSEEYQEFVNSGFNDVFAIFLSGPGFTTATNVAALPDGTPVAINNVNNGINQAYFHDNEAGMGQYVTYDGFTVNLTAFAVVSPEETYHFKVAVADVGDVIYDTGVFLEAFSFRSNEITLGIDGVRPAMRLVRNGDEIIAHLDIVAANAELVVINSAGSIVQRTRVTGDRTVIGLGSLANGIYTMQVHGVDGIAPVRFTVE